MGNRQGTAHSVRRRMVWKLMAGVAIACLAAGCTKTSKKDGPYKRMAAIDYSKQAERPPLKPNNPMYIATTQWARKHQKNPADADAAVNYARSLKALGANDKAFEVLARTYQLNPRNGELASEYGRLALSMGKEQMAEQLLNQAMKARGQTDWRVLSAMGTIYAKRGDHKHAQSYYAAALRQQPGATSVYNNLALSYALDGKAGDAENLLKQAVDKGHNTRVVRQNLALVLGLQSKFDEAQKVAQADLDGNKVENNVSFMRSMVKSTRVAQATAPKAKQTRSADPVTTAALPAHKRKIVRTAKASNAPIPVRKPAQPKIAAAKPGTKLHKGVNPNEVLPWEKKQATEQAPVHKQTQVASLEKNASPAKPTGTSWSISVTETPQEAQNMPAPAQASTKVARFEFPTAK